MTDADELAEVITLRWVRCSCGWQQAGRAEDGEALIAALRTHDCPYMTVVLP